MPAIRLAANISAIQFGKENFIAQIEQLLQETGADPAELELELTESVLMNLDHAMMARLGHLRDMASPWPWTILASAIQAWAI